MMLSVLPIQWQVYAQYYELRTFSNKQTLFRGIKSYVFSYNKTN